MACTIFVAVGDGHAGQEVVPAQVGIRTRP
jgi:hypothetical protein